MQLAMYSKKAKNTTIIICRSVPTSLDVLVHLITITVVVGLAVGLVLAVLSHPANLAQALAALLNSVISAHLSFFLHFFIFSSYLFHLCFCLFLIINDSEVSARPDIPISFIFKDS